MFDSRPNKFMNRALPSPPLVEAAQTPDEEPDADNLYEFISNEDEKGTGVTRPNYEDVENNDTYGEPADAIKPIILDDSPSLSESIGSMLSESSEYLEPVNSSLKKLADPSKPKVKKKISFSKDKSKDKESVLTKHNWQPRACPRGPISGPLGPVLGTGESYVQLYANRDVILDKGKPALTKADGFNKIAAVNLETLQQISEGIYAEFVSVDTKVHDNMQWLDFKLKSERPHYSHGGSALYAAQCAKLTLPLGFLMVRTLLTTDKCGSNIFPGWGSQVLGTLS